MLSGKQFRFNRSVTGIHLINGTPSVVTIPPGAIIRVLSGPDANGKVPDKGIVYVIWQEHTVAVFTVDVEARAIEIGERQDHKQRASA